MSRLSEFFRGKETELGVFYPNHCLVAVFPDQEAAERVAALLEGRGFAKGEAIAANGTEVIELAKEDDGLLSFLVKAMSRFFATEQIFTDHDLERARHGAGFLAVHCPTEELMHKAWQVIEPQTDLWTPAITPAAESSTWLKPIRRQMAILKGAVCTNANRERAAWRFRLSDSAAWE